VLLGRRESCWRFTARQRCCLQAGVVQPLVTVLSKGMELKHTAICRNAAWALSNLIRSVTTSGKEFCGPSLLTPTLVAIVLMSPEQQLLTIVFSFWWMDVANEMCWLLAFLTAREDDVVDLLCQPSTELAWLMPHTQGVVCAALSHRLNQAAGAARAATASSSDTALRALRMTVPCLRTISNIATACQGRHVGT
jgi:Armadillo/beta-catenin-like repeat